MGESLLPNQDTVRNPERDDIVWENVPKKRNKWRARLASVFICLLTAIGIIVHGFAESKTLEYKPVNDISADKLEAIKNGSVIIYTREEKESYTVFLNLGLGLLAIILGTFVDRFSLIFEELFHFKSRYNRSICKMLKACFSGISLGAVVVVSLIVGISIGVPLVKKATFEVRHVTYILSGIGVGPLVMHLLNLNTQSEVHISTIIEEKDTYIANGLAWSYYFNYLAKAVSKFRERFPDNIRTSVQDQGKHVRLSLNKLILLISYDCETEDNLEEQDNTIKKLMEIHDDVYKFPVYSLPYNGKVYKYVIKYVKQPLETLQKMGQYERIKALPEKQRDYQVKLLYRTLSEIVENPLHKECKEKCILVPIKANSIASLNNGRLVNAIMHKVKADESTPEHVDGFEIIPSTQKTKQPKATEDDTSHLHGKIVDLPPSHKVTIDPVEGRAQYSKQDCLSTIVYPEGEQANALERGKELVSGKLQRKYKQKSSPSERQPMLPCKTKQAKECNETQTISMLLKGQTEMDERQSISDDPVKCGGIRQTRNQGGEEYERRPVRSEVQPISGHTAETESHPTSANLQNEGRNSPREDSPPVSNHTGETENQSLSSDFVDGGESRLREEVSNGRPSSSSNLPATDHIEENQNQPMSDGENSPGREEENKEPMSNTSMDGRAEL